MIEIGSKNNLNNAKFIGGFTYEDGTSYTGEWKEGRRHGMGHLNFSSGKSYYGRFEEGLCNGLGVVRFTDGSKYEGEFMNGWFHGHGIFVRSDGMTFEGEFRGGHIWGKGLITYSDGSHGFPRQEGIFQDCRFIRKINSSAAIHAARKLAMLARSQGEFTAAEIYITTP